MLDINSWDVDYEEKISEYIVKEKLTERILEILERHEMSVSSILRQLYWDENNAVKKVLRDLKKSKKIIYKDSNRYTLNSKLYRGIRK